MLYQRQVSIVDEILIGRLVGFAPFPTFRRYEGVAPAQPGPGYSFAADTKGPEQVVQAAAVNSDRQHLTAADHVLERQPRLRAAVPLVGALPAVRAQANAYLDV